MFKKGEVDNLIKELLLRNKGYSRDNIIFTSYCRKKMEERGVSEESIVETINFNDNLYYAERQEVLLKGEKETRHKEIFKISSSYSLIIIVVYEEKVLKVINVICQDLPKIPNLEHAQEPKSSEGS